MKTCAISYRANSVEVLYAFKIVDVKEQRAEVPNVLVPKSTFEENGRNLIEPSPLQHHQLGPDCAQRKALRMLHLQEAHDGG